MNPLFDIILWGATGFTGRLAAEYLAQRQALDEPPICWAIAGRNAAKLTALQKQLPGQTRPPILLADSQDRAALDRLAAQGRVIVSTVGPYARYGTPLVAACAAAGRDYCDITGETPWIREMIDRFHQKAVEKGARLVHCCGFDSIPSDLGTLMTQEFALAEFGRPCPVIKHLFGPSRGGVSGGTVASALNLLAQSQQDAALRRRLADPFYLATAAGPRQRLAAQRGPRYDPDFQSWTAPFVMAAINRQIVYRSAALLDFSYGDAFAYQEAMRAGGGGRGWLRAVVISLGLAGGQLALRSRLIRRLLQNYFLPQPGEGPPAAARDNGFFRTELRGLLPAGAGRPAVVIRARTGGEGDPGYKATAQMLVESALALALDKRAQRPSGVLTPAVALGSILTDRLRASGMTFELSIDAANERKA